MSSVGSKAAPSSDATATVASSAPRSSAGVAAVLSVIVDANGAEAMAQRAARAIGMLPAIRWSELDSPWTSGSDLLTIQLIEGGCSLTVSLMDPDDDAAVTEMGQLLGVVAAMVQRERAIESLAAEARTDALTGLWNRRAFDELIAQGLSRAGRAGERVALLVCDIDHFKQINDTLGHAAGDEALRAVAEATRSVTRPSDVAARMGGDEIAILLAGCDAEGARCVAARLKKSIDAMNPHAGQPLTLSMGIADVSMLDKPSPNDCNRARLFRLADEALYLAKARGRNTVVTHPGDGVVPFRAA